MPEQSETLDQPLNARDYLGCLGGIIFVICFIALYSNAETIFSSDVAKSKGFKDTIGALPHIYLSYRLIYQVYEKSRDEKVQWYSWIWGFVWISLATWKLFDGIVLFFGGK